MIQQLLQDAYDVHHKLLNSKTTHKLIEQLANASIQAIQTNKKIILCGNGGSFADAQHITAELWTFHQ